MTREIRAKIVGSLQSDKIKELAAGYDTHVDRNVNQACSRGNPDLNRYSSSTLKLVCKSRDAIEVIGF